MFNRHSVVAQQYLYHFFVNEGFLNENISLLETIDVNLVTNITYNNKNQTIDGIFNYENDYAKDTYKVHYFDENIKKMVM